MTTNRQQIRRASLPTNLWMHKIKPFFNGSKNESAPEYYDRVRYTRESCKVFSDLWKSDKDFLNKSVDNDISKSFKEFRTSDIASAYSSSSSILKNTINDFISVHEFIDAKRRNWLEKFRTLSEQAREKQLSIRQIMSETRDTYDRTVRKLETAESNLKKFQNRSDRSTVQNFDDRLRELEDIRNECEQARSNAYDIYTGETYRIASEEHSITRDLFAQYLFDEQIFYNDIHQYFSQQIPQIQRRFDQDKLAPSFHCDLAEHCSRIKRSIAYPIETCIRLLENSLNEEGLFRLASAQGKQKKFIAELDLQIIDETKTLQYLGYDPHVVANALKQYLRELPDCLLTSTLLPLWNEIPSLSTDEIRIQRIGELIKQLPKVNYNNLCYLIRFLSRVAEYSSENKMNATNLGICIGCSLLYPKEQISNIFTNCSIIIELMIIHHKQFFPQDNLSYRSTPDLIPTGFQSKNSSSSNESLLEMEIPQPSPRPSVKHRAPPPPPPSTRPLLIQIEPTNIGETSTEQSLFEKITVSNSDRRSGGGGGVQNRLRTSNYNKEQENSLPKDENNLLLISPTSNDGVNIENLNQTNIHIPKNSRYDNLDNSPAEITQF